MKCKCKNIIPEGRLKLGYSVCVECSTVDRYGCAPITFHKTGNSIQIMSSPAAALLLVSGRVLMDTRLPDMPLPPVRA